MPFGLTNAPAVFQHMMNDIFWEYLDHFFVIYLDDTLIYSKNEKKHEHHVRLVLEKLREYGFYAKQEKCLFYQSMVEFLGYIVSGNDISMDGEKIQTTVDWIAPSSVRDVQCFLGFETFYRIFIKDYSQGCHFGRLSEKSLPKDVVRTNVQVGRPSADNQSARQTVLADSRADGLILQWFCAQRTAYWLVWQTAGRPPPLPLGGAAVLIPIVKRSNRPAVGVVVQHAIRQCRPPGRVADVRGGLSRPMRPRLRLLDIRTSDNPDYSKIVVPLTCLTGKDKLTWDEKVEEAFEMLKKAFILAPIFVHADSSKPFFLETDASDFALDSVFSQDGEDGRLHPIAYRSRKFSTVEINYEIHDKELLAIIDAFEEWRHLFEGVQHITTVYIDHKNLEYFMSARVLNRRQAR
jgi:hypothetical protein